MGPKITVTADGRGVVGHAGTGLLADIVDVTGLSGGFGDALRPLRRRDRGHDLGRVAVDVAVMLADGGQAIADLAVLRDQAELFGPIASGPTAWRLLSAMDKAALARLPAAARELAWAQTTETHGGPPASTAARQRIDAIVLEHRTPCDLPNSLFSLGDTRCAFTADTPTSASHHDRIEDVQMDGYRRRTVRVVLVPVTGKLAGLESTSPDGVNQTTYLRYRPGRCTTAIEIRRRKRKPRRS